MVLGTLTAMGLAVGDPYPVFQKDDAGKLKLDKDGHAIADPFTISYKPEDAVTGKAGDAKDPQTFNFHTSAGSVVAPHGFNFVFIQACIAILILVGFESVTAMGEEAKNPKKDIPRAVLLSLVIQGAICYMFEYFAANYFLNSGYTISNAGASGAPLGDMMVHRRHLALRQLCGGQGLHAGAGRHGVPGADRHDPLLHQHRRAGDLCHGPRRGSAVALRPGAWPDALPAPRDLDAGGDLDGHRHHVDGWSISAGNPRTWRRWTNTTSGTASASSRRTLIPGCPTRWSSSR